MCRLGTLGISVFDRGPRRGESQARWKSLEAHRMEDQEEMLLFKPEEVGSMEVVYFLLQAVLLERG